jgi:hypothetical protein
MGGAVYVDGNLTSGGAYRGYMIIWGGNDPNDKQDMFSLRLDTPGSEAWTTITQTNTPLARGYITNAMTAASISGNSHAKYIFLVGGWGSARYSDIQRCTFDVDSPSSVTWTQRVASGTISVRSGVVTDYNSNDGKIYFFGGYTGSSYLNEFYQWDDSGSGTLTQITVTGTAPAGREMGSGGYDPVNNRFWYAGGWTGTTGPSTRNDIGYITNVSSGTRAWVEKRALDNGSTGNHQYAPHALAPSVIDLDNRILFEKGLYTYDSTERYGFAIDLDDSSSSNMPVYGLLESEYMKPRDAPGMVYNPDSDEFLMVGGVDDMYDDTTVAVGGHTSDVWVYNHADNTWRWAAAGIKGIPPSEGRNACYDTSRDRVLLFGGLSGVSQVGNEVWSLTRDSNGNYKAARLNPTGTAPQARWFSALAYDATLDRMIVALGGDGSGPLGGVYSLSFSGGANGAWTTLSPTGSVTNVVGMAFANDAANKKLYLLGGGTNSLMTATSSQVIALDYSTTNCAWGSALASQPTAVRTPAYGFDVPNGLIYVFGGYSGTASNSINTTQVYSISGNSWNTNTFGTSPGARRSAAGCFINSRFYISEGRTDSSIWYGDTWRFTSNSTFNNGTWAELQPHIYNPLYARYTGGTNNTSYHWQTWITDASSDSSTASAGVTKSTYYFDGSDSAASDPQGVWTNDSNAFDGSLTTAATTSSLVSGSNNKLLAQGTNSPTSGDPITSVQARIYASKDDGNFAYNISADIFTDTHAENLGTVVNTPNTTTGAWGTYVTLSTPSGGWTWQKVNDLEVDIYKSGSAVLTASVYRVEVLVTSLNAESSIDFVIGSSAPQYTKTHTTDANKKKSGTKTHTTDSFKRGQFTKTHTTDTIIRGTSFYTRGVSASLPTNTSPQSVGYLASEYATVASDDSTYIDQAGVGYLIHQFERKNTNNTDNIVISWNGKTTLAPSTTPVYLQVYNTSTTSWETLASNSAASANTDFTLSYTISANQSNYYDANNRVEVRVYQGNV